MLSSTSSNLFYVARDFEYVLRDSQGIRDCRSLHMAFAIEKQVIFQVICVRYGLFRSVALKSMHI